MVGYVVGTGMTPEQRLASLKRPRPRDGEKLAASLGVSPSSLQLVADRLGVTTKEAALALQKAKAELDKVARVGAMQDALQVAETVKAASGLPDMPCLIKEAFFRRRKSTRPVQPAGSPVLGSSKHPLHSDLHAKGDELYKVWRKTHDAADADPSVKDPWAVASDAIVAHPHVKQVAAKHGVRFKGFAPGVSEGHWKYDLEKEAVGQGAPGAPRPSRALPVVTPKAKAPGSGVPAKLPHFRAPVAPMEFGKTASWPELSPMEQKAIREGHERNSIGKGVLLGMAGGGLLGLAGGPEGAVLGAGLGGMAGSAGGAIHGHFKGKQRLNDLLESRRNLQNKLETEGMGDYLKSAAEEEEEKQVQPITASEKGSVRHEHYARSPKRRAAAIGGLVGGVMTGFNPVGVLGGYGIGHMMGGPDDGSDISARDIAVLEAGQGEVDPASLDAIRKGHIGTGAGWGGLAGTGLGLLGGGMLFRDRGQMFGKDMTPRAGQAIGALLGGTAGGALGMLGGGLYAAPGARARMEELRPTPLPQEEPAKTAMDPATLKAMMIGGLAGAGLGAAMQYATSRALPSGQSMGEMATQGAVDQSEAMGEDSYLGKLRGVSARAMNEAATASREHPGAAAMTAAVPSAIGGAMLGRKVLPELLR